MVEKLAKALAAWQIRRGFLKTEDQALYEYAFELLIGQVVNLWIACLLAVIFHAYLEILVFFLFFIPLRSYAGGHHADNFNRCTILSSLILLLVCIAMKWIPLYMTVSVNAISGVLCGILIFCLAPVADHNKPLDQAERQRYGKASRIIWLIETAVWIAFYLLHQEQVCLVMGLSHLAVAMVLCAGVVKNEMRGSNK